MGRKIVFGVIILFYSIELLSLAMRHVGEPIRIDMALAQLLVLLIPIRSARPDGTRLYSAMLYRVASVQSGDGKRERKIQLYPKNFKPWDT